MSSAAEGGLSCFGSANPNFDRVGAFGSCAGKGAKEARKLFQLSLPD